MNTIYINDTTIVPNKIVTFNSIQAAINHLQEMAKRTQQRSRKNIMLEMESLGYGGEDRDSINFIRAMSMKFDIGVVKDNRYVRTDITSLINFNKFEFGD